jgi:hypothetical protein
VLAPKIFSSGLFGPEAPPYSNCPCAIGKSATRIAPEGISSTRLEEYGAVGIGRRLFGTPASETSRE